MARSSYEELARQRASSRYIKTKRKRTKKPFIITLVVLLAIALGVFAFFMLRPVHVFIDDEEKEFPGYTTYQTLIDKGILNAEDGDLIDVTGEILEKGSGEKTAVLVNDVKVDNRSSFIKNGATISTLRGEDITEPAEIEESVKPFTVEIKNYDNFSFYNGVLHMITQDGKDGVSQKLIGEISGKRVENKEVVPMQTELWQSLNPELASGEKVVALTFDDGPKAGDTEAVLSALRNHDVKATFFMLGTSVENYPEIAAKVAEEGHQVASHTYSHAAEDYLSKLDSNGVREQLEHAQRVIKEATGVETTIVRPPGGNMKAEDILASQGVATAFVGWSIDTLDYTRPGPKEISETIVNGIEPGAIVLMHDGGGDRSQTVEALDKTIIRLKDKGYRFVTIDELIELKKAELQKQPAN